MNAVTITDAGASCCLLLTAATCLCSSASPQRQ